MTGHTPGPWMAGPMVGESDTIWIGNGDGYVAQVTRIDGLEPIDWADARLISAAPEMLAALEALVVSHLALCNSPEWDEQDEAEQAQARAIIAKVKGFF
jgi:hypothetical protein